MATRKADFVTNFWKAIAVHRRPCAHVGDAQVGETPGALDALTKEMLYLAVSATNGCDYCIARTPSPRGGTDDGRDAGRAHGRRGMANETNRLADGYQVEVERDLQ